jgi:hypothetical protein
LEQSHLEHGVAAPGPATMKVPHREAYFSFVNAILSALFYERQTRRRKDFVGLPALCLSVAILVLHKKTSEKQSITPSVFDASSVLREGGLKCCYMTKKFVSSRLVRV